MGENLLLLLLMGAVAASPVLLFSTPLLHFHCQNKKIKKDYYIYMKNNVPFSLQFDIVE